MTALVIRRRRSVSWGDRAVRMMLAAALLLPLLVVAPTMAGQAKIQPALLNLAAEQPEALVDVIVQKTGEGATAEALVSDLGGEITNDLRIINAFAAELTARAVKKLATSPAVRWVSLDAPIESSAITPVTETVRDEFNAVSFRNNNGTANWAGDWIEINEFGGPDSGDLRVFYGMLLIKDDNQGIKRTVDLSGATGATLSFDYDDVGFDDYRDYVTLEISADGGATWTTLDRFDGPSGWGDPYYPQMKPASYDISGYMSANTTIRFFTARYLGNDDYLYVDNVQVEYALAPCPGCPANTYLDTLNVQSVWDMGYQGQGIGIAVIDSGISNDADFGARVKQQITFIPGSNEVADTFGHGSHVAGIIGGDGSGSNGFYHGIAPGADLYSLRVSDDSGAAQESDVVAALQWIYDNHAQYNIRVVNMSVNTTVEESYHNSAINAAAEILWYNGIVVVCSAGNIEPFGSFNTANAAPANDPFLITVGSSLENGTADRSDDTIGDFSASAITLDGYTKPDVIAPGKDIYSVLSDQSTWGTTMPGRVVDGGEYFRLSGTSMSAPMVTGAVALMVQAQPDLNPDQVKYRLMNSGSTIDGYPYLDVMAAVTSTSTEMANDGQIVSNMLTTGSEPVTSSVSWSSVSWSSVSWSSVSWSSVSWSSVSWSSVSWSSVSWSSVSWSSVSWND